MVDSLQVVAVALRYVGEGSLDVPSSLAEASIEILVTQLKEAVVSCNRTLTWKVLMCLEVESLALRQKMLCESGVIQALPLDDVANRLHHQARPGALR